MGYLGMVFFLPFWVYGNVLMLILVSILGLRVEG